jgi:hypothetical protein
VSGEGFAIGLTLFDTRRQRVATQWSYDPKTNPLVIGVAISTTYLPPALRASEAEQFIIDRTLLVATFENAPRTYGNGVVRLWVPREGAMRIGLFVPGRVPAVLAASVDAVLAFTRATLASVPVCAGRGYCEHPLCVECAWLRRQIPFCPCGSPGCFYHRPSE